MANAMRATPRRCSTCVPTIMAGVVGLPEARILLDSGKFGLGQSKGPRFHHFVPQRFIRNLGQFRKTPADALPQFICGGHGVSPQWVRYSVGLSPSQRNRAVLDPMVGT